MPVYEYECQSCSQRIERIQKFSDPPLTRCESCGGTLRKLFSPSALVFKGSGFYITDYAKKDKERKDKEKKQGQAQDSNASGEKKAEGKAEGKSEKKSEDKTKDTSTPAKTNEKPSSPPPSKTSQ